MDNPEHHHNLRAFAVVIVNLVATVLKFGDRTQMGAVLLATSLVAVLQLLTAVIVGSCGSYIGKRPYSGGDSQHRLSLGRGNARQCGFGCVAGNRTVMLRR